MGGVDAIRGITYQHVCAMTAALDVVEDAEGGSITIEGTADIVDYEIVDRHSELICIAQVKSRKEPYSWRLNEISAIIKKWSETKPLCLRFEFISDGPLRDDAHKAIVEPLSRLIEQRDEEHAKVLRSALSLPDTPLDIFRRVRIKTRHGSTEGLLHGLEMRVLRLLEMSGQASSDEAEAGVNKLFRAVSMAGGDPNLVARNLSRLQLAVLLGASLDTIDRAGQWDAEVQAHIREHYRQNLAPHIAVLGACLQDASHPALRLQPGRAVTPHNTDPVPITELFEANPRLAICGVAGAGKTTTIQLLCSTIAEEGGIPIAVSPGEYLRNELPRLIRESLEHSGGTHLAPGAVHASLQSEGATLLVDGATELPPHERLLLVSDLDALLKAHPGLRCIVTGRQAAVLQQLGLVTCFLCGMSATDRATLAAALLDDDSDKAAIQLACENGLGDAASNPLLYTMALALASQGRPTNSGVDLYQGAISGLFARLPQECSQELAVETLGLVAHELLAGSKYQTNRYSWLRLIGVALSKISGDGLFDVKEVTAEGLFESLIRVGVISMPFHSRNVAFLHDSFRDFLVSVALARGVVSLPSYLGVDWEASVCFLSEATGVDDELARQLIRDNPVAATKVARFHSAPRSSQALLAHEFISGLLNLHVGREVAAAFGLAKLGVRCFKTDSHSWIAISREGDTCVVSDLAQLIQNSEDTILVIGETGDWSPLSMATAAWRNLALRAMRPAEPWLPPAVSSACEELRVAVERCAVERRDHLIAMASRVIPSLAGRVIEKVGWTGLVAQISPDIVGASSHSMFYQYVDGPDDVQIETDPIRTFARMSFGQTSVESFLEDPSRAAAEALCTAFNELLDGGRG
ncbi:NACHT domain-containing protein [Myxococcota bacterium]